MLVAQGTADCLVSSRALDYLWYCVPNLLIFSFEISFCLIVHLSNAKKIKNKIQNFSAYVNSASHVFLHLAFAVYSVQAELLKQ